MPAIIEAFFTFAQEEQRREAAELIAAEGLNEAAAKRYLEVSLKRGYASENGTELSDALPKMSPLNPLHLAKNKASSEKSPPSWKNSWELAAGCDTGSVHEGSDYAA